MATSEDKERYIMQDNDGELQRLANQHVVLKSGMGALALAPVHFGRLNLRILDSGTADGLWLRDLDESVGGTHTYVGTDIVEDYFPNPAPERCSFHVQSITKDWPDDWTSTFDYVHQRLTLPGAGPNSLSDCVRGLANVTKPGGLVELQESDFTGESTNGPVVKRFEALMSALLDAVGVGFDYGAHLKTYLKDAGLEQVQDKTFSIPYGAACSDAHVREKSILALMSAARGLHALVKGDTGKEGQDAESFVKEIRAELEERGAHFKTVAAWGRKSS